MVMIGRSMDYRSYYCSLFPTSPVHLADLTTERYQHSCMIYLELKGFDLSVRKMSLFVRVAYPFRCTYNRGLMWNMYLFLPNTLNPHKSRRPFEICWDTGVHASFTWSVPFDLSLILHAATLVLQYLPATLSYRSPAVSGSLHNFRLLFPHP